MKQKNFDWPAGRRLSGKQQSTHSQALLDLLASVSDFPRACREFVTR
ncbi:MAG: hypothetical protein ACLUN5_06435 [Oscillospiraceae bacterium]